MEHEIELKILAEPGNGSETWVIALLYREQLLGIGSARRKRDAEFKTLEQVVTHTPLQQLESPLEHALKQRLRITHGAWKEWRLLGAIRSLKKRKPRWLKHIRRASMHEESMGFDLIAKTDRGEIPIQIKSTTKGIEHFLKKKKSQPIIIRYTDDTDVRHVVKTTIDKLYQRYRKLPAR